MKLSREALRGYILEEVLAYLIRNTGYRLLVDKDQDPQELDWKYNGLVVKGRGGVHQVDVLGELSWIPAFTYPLRLFVEAKFRGARTGIAEVRNMVGTLLDVNQNNLPQVIRQAGGTPQLRPKYYYAGAIFSTSGFSAPAMDMGLAHSISLIELNMPEFQPLLDGVTATADSIVQWMQPELQEDGLGEQDSDASEESAMPGMHQSRSRFLFALRTALRRTLKTQTSEERQEITELASDIAPQLERTTAMASQVGQLFVGIGQGPFMLVLKADDPARFLQYARQHPTHDVMISWTRALGDGATWSITPSEQDEALGHYRLTFRLPKPIRDWVFSAENIPKTAMDAKRRYFSNITIFHTEGDRDLLIRLRFNPLEIRTE